MKRKFWLKGFLKDAIKTILVVPIHLLAALYAVGAQCVLQLIYDYRNNWYEVWNEEEKSSD